MSASGVSVDPEKVEAVMSWERPKSFFEIRSFLGLAWYYRRHYGMEEFTWEREDTMRATYPFLFRDEGTWFSCLAIK